MLMEKANAEAPADGMMTDLDVWKVGKEMVLDLPRGLEVLSSLFLGT